LAGALAAAKLHIPVLHIEAGLRSFNRRMPEELNRITTDHLSTALYAPTRTAMDNLSVEGLAQRALLTGDVMYDAVLFNAQRARRSGILRQLGVEAGSYGVATIHRAENTLPDELRKVLQALNEAATRFGRIVFPMHPRTAAILKSELPDWRPAPTLLITNPLGYLDMLALVQASNWVLTDSGGLQKEAYFLGRPCITLRNETEWLETLQGGANCIAGGDGVRLIEHLSEVASRPRRPFEPSAVVPGGPFGAGDAARKIVTALCDLIAARA